MFLLAFHSSIVAIPAQRSEQTVSGGATDEAGFSRSALYPGVYIQRINLPEGLNKCVQDCQGLTTATPVG